MDKEDGRRTNAQGRMRKGRMKKEDNEAGRRKKEEGRRQK